MAVTIDDCRDCETAWNGTIAAKVDDPNPAGGQSVLSVSVSRACAQAMRLGHRVTVSVSGTCEECGATSSEPHTASCAFTEHFPQED